MECKWSKSKNRAYWCVQGRSQWRDPKFVINSTTTGYDKAVITAAREAIDRDGIVTRIRNNCNSVKRDIFSKIKTKHHLELACGRGGDIFKIDKITDLDSCVFVDFAPKALKEAVRRAQKSKRRDIFRFFLADLSLAWPKHGKLYTSASIMFAFHYFCKNKSACNTFVSNLSKSLAKGATVYGITTNWVWLSKKFSSSNVVYPIQDFKGCFFSICNAFPTNIHEKCWGVEFSYFLQECVPGLVEYIVYWPVVESICNNHGLYLESLVPMSSCCNFEGEYGQAYSVFTLKKY